MFKATFSPTDSFIEQYQKLSPEKQGLFKDIFIGIFCEIFNTNVQNYQFEISNNAIAITAMGVAHFSPADHDYYVQQIGNKLAERDLKHFFKLTHSISRVEPYDKSLAPSSRREANYPEAMIQIFDLDNKNIPSEYTCPILFSLIGNPAYLTTNPLVSYEYKALFNWVSEKKKDPTTRKQVEVSDIIFNTNLKKRITNFVVSHALGKDIENHHIRTRDIGIGTEELEQKNGAEEKAAEEKLQNSHSFFVSPKAKLNSPAHLLQVFTTCKLTEQFNSLMGKALRRAANAGLDKEIQIILSNSQPDAIINLQDDNPKIKNTALHCAIINMRKSTIQLLLSYGAKTNIKNAEGKTALALMQASSNALISELGFERTTEETLLNATSLSAKMYQY